MDLLLVFLADGLTGASPPAILAYTLLATHVTIVAVTVYLHRHQAHRALSLHPLVAHFFRFWLWHRSLASEEQLMEALSAWCARAAADGCAQVRSFAAELKRYA